MSEQASLSAAGHSEIASYKNVLDHVNRMAVFDFEQTLEFLLDDYPQTEDGEIQWLLEGGGAVKLLANNQRQVKDIDFITNSVHYCLPFQSSRVGDPRWGWFDARDSLDWLAIRDLPSTPELAKLLMSSPSVAKFRGRQVLTLNVNIIAASKMLRFGDCFPRPKDRLDVLTLETDPRTVASIIDLFESNRVSS